MGATASKGGNARPSNRNRILSNARSSYFFQLCSRFSSMDPKGTQYDSIDSHADTMHFQLAPSLKKAKLVYHVVCCDRSDSSHDLLHRPERANIVPPNFSSIIGPSAEANALKQVVLLSNTAQSVTAKPSFVVALFYQGSGTGLLVIQRICPVNALHDWPSPFPLIPCMASKDECACQTKDL